MELKGKAIQKKKEQPSNMTVPKYKWTPQAHHTDQLQNSWVREAVAIFNIDERDALLSAAEKHRSLSYLAEELTTLERAGNKRNENRIVQSALRMAAGDEPVQHEFIVTALLRWKLKPPQALLRWGIMRRYLHTLVYLRLCVNGDLVYSTENLREALNERAVTVVNKADGGGVVPGDGAEAAIHSGVVATPASKAEKNSGSVITEEVKKLMGGLKKIESLVGGMNSAPPTNPNKHTAAQDTGDNKRAKHQGQPRDQSQDQTKDQTQGPRQARWQFRGYKHVDARAELLRERKSIEEIAQTGCELFKDVGRPRAAREMLLTTFAGELETHGWADLAELAREIIKEEDQDSRKHLADRLVVGVVPRLEVKMKRVKAFRKRGGQRLMARFGRID